MNESIKHKAEKIINKFDSEFRFRADIYNDLLISSLDDNTSWLDLGCGENSDVKENKHLCQFAVGVDIYMENDISDSPFVGADISQLPFSDNSFDFISLRFVVEHLYNIKAVFQEIERVLKPGGKVLIMTTNILSPFIFLPGLLPEKLKNYIQRKIFKVASNDILPTFHRLNSKSAFLKLSDNFELTHFEYIQDTNLSRMWLFKLFFGWHLLTKTLNLKFSRTNILAVFHK